MTSFVYISTNVAQPVDLQLVNCGPDAFSVGLLTTKLNPQVSKAKVMSIERNTGSYVMFDVAFLISGTYVASYGALLRGHGIGSSIWWRWRTADAVLDWVTDHTLHRTRVLIGTSAFDFSIRGDTSLLGHDDLLVELRSSI
ncbi:hypothetical protein D3093_35505 (plasmid) [Azospirillum argentinense]|uniref:Uncharacterized protein n=1 Tax=Azospirillum argentinense TaxID=2970906 RepID=A0A4D8PT85_9PROT|nr:hypothetical protein [Azospirillum argentinense]QCO00551.1 hypothetical protein D3093_35505 [Azospirillum argentinense]